MNEGMEQEKSKQVKLSVRRKKTSIVSFIALLLLSSSSPNVIDLILLFFLFSLDTTAATAEMKLLRHEWNES
jgi:hypothetical protein